MIVFVEILKDDYWENIRLFRALCASGRQRSGTMKSGIER